MGNLVRIPVLVVGLLLFSAPAALAGDLEDVQAVFKQGIAAYNAKNVDGAMATLHDQAVGFGPGAPFAGESNAFRRPGLTAFFASLETLNVTPINFQFRVFGDTAVAWGYFSAVSKPKDGPSQVVFVRATQTFAKSGGKWMLVSSHMSSIPSGN